MPQNDGTLLMENARIVLRNFAGKEGMYNREGDRNFCILLDDDVAEAMANDGWNVKFFKNRDTADPEEPRQPYLITSVSYKGRPPKIVMITSKGRTELTEDEIEILDWVDIDNVDLIVRPYEWRVGDKTGIKAYLKSLYVTINEDALELKYAHIDEAQLPSRSGRVDE